MARQAEFSAVHRSSVSGDAPNYSGYPAAVVLIVLFYLLGLSASTRNSATFDEGSHIVGGYIHWTLGQPRIHTENGYLSQAIASLPLLSLHLHPPDTTSPEFRIADSFLLGRKFLYESGNDASQMLLLSRGAIGLLAAATAFMVYLWARRLFGPGGGMLSLLVFILSPVVLAHGFLATSDMAVTCFFLLSLGLFWWSLQRITLLRVVATSVAIAGLFLSKMSAPLIIPVMLVLVAYRVIAGGSLPLHVPLGHPRMLAGRWARLVAGAAMVAVIAILVFSLIWAVYGFTFSAFKDSPPDSGQIFRNGGWDPALHDPNAALRAIAFARDAHLLPESFLYGYAFVVQTTRVVITFADGVVTRQGWWWFYPFVFLVTTPFSVLLLSALAASKGVVRFFHRPGTQWAAGGTRWGYHAMPLVVFLIVYWTAAILSYRGSGPRHLLPAYAALCILLGSAVWLPLRQNLRRAALVFVVLVLGAESFLVCPHYLSFFNALAGGPAEGYRLLVDSTVDWGQDLPALSDYLSRYRRHGAAVYLAYFGSADPDYYHIEATALPSFLPLAGQASAVDRPLAPGIYCISVTILQNLYSDYEGNYTAKTEALYGRIRQWAHNAREVRDDPQRFAALSAQQRAAVEKLPTALRNIELVRLCAYLRKREPVAQAGYSINIYAVSAEDLNAGLNGPPPFD